MNSPQIIDNLVVEAKPSPWTWLPTMFFALMGVGAAGVILAAPNNDLGTRLLGAAVLVLPFFLIAGGAALWTLQSRIVADAEGLRWRSIGRWRAARWDQVTDYYDRQLHRKNAPRTVVETEAGNINQINDLSNREALREIIARRATRARAQGWGLKGTRPEDDWPQVFGYNTTDNRSLPWIIGGCTVLLIGLFAGCFLPKILQLASEIGWPMALAAGLMMLVVLLAQPVVLIAISQPAMREVRKRRKETITVDLEGIQWQHGPETIKARWEEVTDYHLGPSPGRIQTTGPAVVVTRRGTFDFTHSIEKAALLREIIRRYATEARAKEWRGPEIDRLGDEASRWTGGCIGVGQKRFHYRTRTNRAVLGLPCAYWLGWVISGWIGPLHEKASSEPVFFYTVGALLTLGMLWPFWRYHAAAVLVDEQGIAQRAWNGTAYLPWSEVEQYFTSGSEGFRWGNVVGRGKRIRFWLGIADLEELQAEIRARAVNTQTRDWNVREPE